MKKLLDEKYGVCNQCLLEDHNISSKAFFFFELLKECPTIQKDLLGHPEFFKMKSIIEHKKGVGHASI